MCVEALLDTGATVLGCVSRDGTGLRDQLVPMLGSDDDLAATASRCGATHAFVAVGDNRARAELTTRCEHAGLGLATAVSRFARLSRQVELRDGAALLPGATVNAATRIGVGAIVNTNASVDHDCSIGEFVHIAPGVSIAGGVTVGPHAFIGIGARVIPGITIGAGAIVGAGATVIRDVPADSTVIGVPAKPIRRCT